MPIKNIKIKISKNKKKVIFSHVPRITQPKNSVPKPKSVPFSPRTHRRTDTHESEYRGHPFRVSGIVPSTYHQGSAQNAFFSDAHRHTHTEMKVNTEDTLSGFQELFLQSITKDRAISRHRYPMSNTRCIRVPKY